MESYQIVPIEENVKIDEFRPGDTVRVSISVQEGERRRTQAFEGVVIRRRGGGTGESFTVRRVAHGIGVERTFLLHSPAVEALSLVRRGVVRRSRLVLPQRTIGSRGTYQRGAAVLIRAHARRWSEETSRKALRGTVLH